MNNSTSPDGRNVSVKRIVIDGLAVALVFVSAMFVHIRLPVVGVGAMIHMGDLPLFIFALLFGRRTGALAGAFGLALFDLLSGWSPWAPFSFVIAGAMGWLVGFGAEKNHRAAITPYALSILAANAITVGGYYLAECVLYGNWITPVGSIPINALQVTLPAVLAFPIARRLQSIRFY